MLGTSHSGLWFSCSLNVVLSTDCVFNGFSLKTVWFSIYFSSCCAISKKEKEKSSKDDYFSPLMYLLVLTVVYSK